MSAGPTLLSSQAPMAQKHPFNVVWCSKHIFRLISWGLLKGWGHKTVTYDNVVFGRIKARIQLFPVDKQGGNLVAPVLSMPHAKRIWVRGKSSVEPGGSIYYSKRCSRGWATYLGSETSLILPVFFFFFCTSIIAMKVISVNSKWKFLERTLELLECFISSPLLVSFSSELLRAGLHTPRNFQKPPRLSVCNATLRVTLIFNILLIKSQLKRQWQTRQCNHCVSPATFLPSPRHGS